MGRINRQSILIDGCYAHVMSRATDKCHLFRSEDDFVKFKEFLQLSKTRHCFRIHHYCLMHTHFHLVVSMDDAKLFSEGIKWIKWQYARYFNHSEQRFGPCGEIALEAVLSRICGASCGKYMSKRTPWKQDLSIVVKIGPTVRVATILRAREISLLMDTVMTVIRLIILANLRAISEQ